MGLYLDPYQTSNSFGSDQVNTNAFVASILFFGTGTPMNSPKNFPRRVRAGRDF